MYSDAMKDFMYKVFVKSGIGAERTYLPRWIHPKHSKTPVANMSTAMEEAEMVMGGAVADVLAKTGALLVLRGWLFHATSKASCTAPNS